MRDPLGLLEDTKTPQQDPLGLLGPAQDSPDQVSDADMRLLSGQTHLDAFNEMQELGKVKPTPTGWDRVISRDYSKPASTEFTPGRNALEAGKVAVDKLGGVLNAVGGMVTWPATLAGGFTAWLSHRLAYDKERAEKAEQLVTDTINKWSRIPLGPEGEEFEHQLMSPLGWVSGVTDAISKKLGLDKVKLPGLAGEIESKLAQLIKEGGSAALAFKGGHRVIGKAFPTREPKLYAEPGEATPLELGPEGAARAAAASERMFPPNYGANTLRDSLRKYSMDMADSYISMEAEQARVQRSGISNRAAYEGREPSARERARIAELQEPIPPRPTMREVDEAIDSGVADANKISREARAKANVMPFEDFEVEPRMVPDPNVPIWDASEGRPMVPNEPVPHRTLLTPEDTVGATATPPFRGEPLGIGDTGNGPLPPPPRTPVPPMTIREQARLRYLLGETDFNPVTGLPTKARIRVKDAAQEPPSAPPPPPESAAGAGAPSPQPGGGGAPPTTPAGGTTGKGKPAKVSAKDITKMSEGDLDAIINKYVGPGGGEGKGEGTGKGKAAKATATPSAGASAKKAAKAAAESFKSMAAAFREILGNERGAIGDVPVDPQRYERLRGHIRNAYDKAIEAGQSADDFIRAVVMELKDLGAKVGPYIKQFVADLRAEEEAGKAKASETRATTTKSGAGTRSVNVVRAKAELRWRKILDDKIAKAQSAGDDFHIQSNAAYRLESERRYGTDEYLQQVAGGEKVKAPVKEPTKAKEPTKVETKTTEATPISKGKQATINALKADIAERAYEINRLTNINKEIAAKQERIDVLKGKKSMSKMERDEYIELKFALDTLRKSSSGERAIKSLQNKLDHRIHNLNMLEGREPKVERSKPRGERVKESTTVPASERNRLLRAITMATFRRDTIKGLKVKKRPDETDEAFRERVAAHDRAVEAGKVGVSKAWADATRAKIGLTELERLDDRIAYMEEGIAELRKVSKPTSGQVKRMDRLVQEQIYALRRRDWVLEQKAIENGEEIPAKVAPTDEEAWTRYGTKVEKPKVDFPMDGEDAVTVGDIVNVEMGDGTTRKGRIIAEASPNRWSIQLKPKSHGEKKGEMARAMEKAGIKGTPPPKPPEEVRREPIEPIKERPVFTKARSLDEINAEIDSLKGSASTAEDFRKMSELLEERSLVSKRSTADEAAKAASGVTMTEAEIDAEIAALSSAHKTKKNMKRLVELYKEKPLAHLKAMKEANEAMARRLKEAETMGSPSTGKGISAEERARQVEAENRGTAGRKPSPETTAKQDEALRNKIARQQEKKGDKEWSDEDKAYMERAGRKREADLGDEASALKELKKLSRKSKKAPSEQEVTDAQWAALGTDEPAPKKGILRKTLGNQKGAVSADLVPVLVKGTVKGVRKLLRNSDKLLRDQIKDWLEGKTKTMPVPTRLYRGVIVGLEVDNKQRLTHATPWGDVAIVGGKWGDAHHDVYKIPARDDTIYYRGGSLAGDPMERTRIFSEQGMTWSEIMAEAKRLYAEDMTRERAKNRKLPPEPWMETTTRNHVLSGIIADIHNASYETDFGGEPGVWRNRPLSPELKRAYPKLRSYDDLQDIVNIKRNQGYEDSQIPEIDIIKSAYREVLPRWNNPLLNQKGSAPIIMDISKGIVDLTRKTIDTARMTTKRLDTLVRMAMRSGKSLEEFGKGLGLNPDELAYFKNYAGVGSEKIEAPVKAPATPKPAPTKPTRMTTMTYKERMAERRAARAEAKLTAIKDNKALMTMANKESRSMIKDSIAERKESITNKPKPPLLYGQHSTDNPYQTGKVIKQRQVGTGDQPLWAPAVTEGEATVVRALKDLPRRIGKWSIEVANETFDKLGSEAKELFYRPMATAHHNMTVEIEATSRWLKNLGRDINRKSRQRIGTHLISLREGGKDYLKKSGKTIPTLTPNEMRIANEIQGGFKKFYDRINDARVRSGLRPFKRVENYITFFENYTRAQELGWDPISTPTHLLENKFAHLRSTPFRFLESRRDIYRVRTDAFDIYKRYSTAALRHIHVGPEIAKGRELLGNHTDPATGKVFSLKGSHFKPGAAPNTHAFLTEWYDNLAGTRAKFGLKPLTERAIAQLTDNIAISTMGGNFRSTSIQPTALLNSWTEIGTKYLMKGILDLFDADSREMSRLLSNHLLGRNFDVSAMNVYRDSIMGLTGKVFQGAKRWSMKPLSSLDYLAAIATWRGAYRKGISEGMSRTKASNYADDVVVRTQGSAAMTDRAPIQQHTLGRAATIFQTFTLSNWSFLKRHIAGIGNPKLKPYQRMKRAIMWIGGASLINTLYETLLQTQSPFPSPIQAAKESLEEGGDVTAATLNAALELLQPVPLVGSMRFGTTPLGAGAQFLSDVSFKASSRQGPSKSTLELAGKAAGVPGTVQVAKTLRAVKKGATPMEALFSTKPPKHTASSVIQ